MPRQVGIYQTCIISDVFTLISDNLPEVTKGIEDITSLIDCSDTVIHPERGGEEGTGTATVQPELDSDWYFR